MARLSGEGQLQFLIQAQIAVVDDYSEAEVAARRVIPWVASGGGGLVWSISLGDFG